ncbi:NADPH:quinone reductase [Nocardioides albus]|uniref:NADPH2:quinone reductase n=1 Tax=Nocardioides albus TaxID=1841 RepID=A0A7W5A999_9ACTN|nr:NADPH:quinone reductase [Nocardioides albus]MBB3091760.1 NADPH2:quinone reductase [Nocardioides albus]GGU32054.1 NADPH:quinone reductase [Nocardioides albus]
MRAVVYSENGPSSTLRLTERPVPKPGPGEVLVRLVRAGVNPTDWKLRAGLSGTLSDPEVTPGQDGAGVVEAIGEGVSTHVVGQPVWLFMTQHGQAWGTAAEYVTVPARKAVELPADASFDLGAALGVPAMTAHRALTSGTVERVAPESFSGLTILVHGGAGAVGNAAIQLAVWAGARVITTVSSPEKAALAKAAGAHHIVNYREGDAAAAIQEIAPDGVDQIVEVAPAVNNDLDRTVIAKRGTIAIYANNGGDELTMPLRATFSLNLRYQFIQLYGIEETQIRAAAEDVTAAVTAGALRVGPEGGVPLHHYRLEETAAAHDAVEAGAVGKVLIDLE